MQKGKLFVIVGPSGAGKGSILAQVFADMPHLKYSISATTRQPREGEIHAQHYFFLSHDEFRARIAEDDFLEWAEFVGNYYGTPSTYINAQLDAGHDVILEIELEWAKQIKQKCPEAVFIFIAPPSIEILQDRLFRRSTDDAQAIQNRIQKAKGEMQFAFDTQGFFDAIIINEEGKLSKSIENLKKMLIKS